MSGNNSRLGIDIVDLKDEKLKDRDERALRLILNEKDQLIDHPHIFWLLWSAKEAVFKCNREAINYTPTSIPIALEVGEGRISFTSGSYKGRIDTTNDYIISICSDRIDMMDFQIMYVDKLMDGVKLRRNVLQFFQERGLSFEMGSDDLNLPILLPSKVPISITHHGRFGAFIYPTSITI